MFTGNLIGLVISYVYAGSLLVIGELLQRFAGLPGTITRKLIHVGAGMWIFGVLALFDQWQYGIIPFATFIGLNYLFYRFQVFGAMDREGRSLGTVYFAVSVTLLFLIFWRPEGPVDRVPLAVAALMTMTWGDALAALIGSYFGRHRYHIGSSTRSWEGSLVMLLVSMLVITLSLSWLPGSSLAPLALPYTSLQIGLAAVVGGLLATLAEALAPHGLDNLSVPLSVALLLAVLL